MFTVDLLVDCKRIALKISMLSAQFVQANLLQNQQKSCRFVDKATRRPKATDPEITQQRSCKNSEREG